MKEEGSIAFLSTKKKKFRESKVWASPPFTTYRSKKNRITTHKRVEQQPTNESKDSFKFFFLFVLAQKV